MTTTATDFLHQSMLTLSSREKDYDQPSGERSMQRTVNAFNIITDRDITEAEGWLLLQILKDTRQWSKKQFHYDSALDSVAYAALKAESLANTAVEVHQPC